MTDPALLPFDRLIVLCLHRQGIAITRLLVEAISPTVAFIALDDGTLDAAVQRPRLAAIGEALLLSSPWAVQLECIDGIWFLWVSRRLDAVPPPVADQRPRAPAATD